MSIVGEVITDVPQVLEVGLEPRCIRSDEAAETVGPVAHRSSSQRHPLASGLDAERLAVRARGSFVRIVPEGQRDVGDPVVMVAFAPVDVIQTVLLVVRKQVAGDRPRLAAAAIAATLFDAFVRLYADDRHRYRTLLHEDCRFEARLSHISAAARNGPFR